MSKYSFTSLLRRKGCFVQVSRYSMTVNLSNGGRCRDPRTTLTPNPTRPTPQPHTCPAPPLPHLRSQTPDWFSAILGPRKGLCFTFNSDPFVRFLYDTALVLRFGSSYLKQNVCGHTDTFKMSFFYHPSTETKPCYSDSKSIKSRKGRHKMST